MFSSDVRLVGGGGVGSLKEQDIHLDQIGVCLSLMKVKDLRCLHELIY